MDHLGRRNFLRTTALLAAGTALAGCAADEGGEKQAKDEGGGNGTTDAEKNESTGGDGTDADDEDGTDSGEGEDQDGPDLGIVNIHFVDGQPADYREYTAVPDATYQRGDIVWIYFEGVGLPTEDAGFGNVTIPVTLELDVTNPDGKTHSFTREATKQIAEEDLDEQYFYWNFKPEAPAAVGQYTAELRLRNDQTGESVRAEATFSFEGSETEPFLDTYGNVLTDRLDIDVTELRIENKTVYLSYTSPFSRGTGENNFQLGYVAGRYADQIANGWDADELVVTMTDSDGDRYRFTLPTTLAQQWNADEVSTEEFVDQFLATVDQLDDE